jgi:hypothetical protein
MVEVKRNNLGRQNEQQQRGNNHTMERRCNEGIRINYWPVPVEGRRWANIGRI